MRLRSLAHRTASAVGLPAVARRAFANRPLILCYHAVSEGAPDVPDPDGTQLPEALFTEQIRYIAKHYHPVSLQELMRTFGGGHDLPRNTVLVTFDDGYRNVVRNALPCARITAEGRCRVCCLLMRLYPSLATP